ncbi:MAG TPA: flagellar basal body P-ring formation chaperone FlgA [Rhizomicrobium sp.]|nr:flagellar basal body P-ring formation chaperone FlgA [Rhizomicrobium sp.]
MKALFLFVCALIMAYPAFADRAFADTGVRIVVPARDIARGDTISESDLTYAFVAPNAIMPGAATNMNAIVGMQTRRVLRAGETMRNDDVRAPIVVVKGTTVTMVFDAPGVTLTATGRAMSEGGVGDTVTVQNPASFRQISAVVTGPGTVKALSGMGVISTRVASR